MSSDKTEEPTPRRLRKARQQGDVPVSSALSQTVSLCLVITLLPSAAQHAYGNFTQQLEHALSGQLPSAAEAATLLLLGSVPLLAVAALGAAAASAVQTGGLFAPSRLVPNLSQLDPIAGLKKLFSLDRVSSALRALAMALLVAWVVASLLRAHAGSVLATLGDARAALALASALSSHLLWVVTGLSLGFAALDVWVLRRSWLRRNRMSKDEVQREYRESEGDPQLKQERRRAHQEMLNSASLLAVKDASVLIVNPTHLATALRYDAQGEGAPSVVAQGEGAFALRLIEAARAYGVPVVRDVPVARALRELTLGDEIPEELYEAVAEILRELQAQGEPNAGEPTQ